MKFPSNPEVIASVSELISDGGDELYHGDKIAGISVRQTDTDRDGTVDIDVRCFGKKQTNLMIRIPLPELMAALASATLNAQRD